MRLQLRLDDEAAQLEIERHIQEEKDEVYLKIFYIFYNFIFTNMHCYNLICFK